MSVPESMVVGQTTRTQVLLALGEPDGHSADDSWFVYGALERRGGLRWAWVAAVGLAPGAGGVTGGHLGNWDSSRRLTIRFDERGIVSDASVEQRDCTASGAGGQTCLDVAGSYLSVSDDAARNVQLRANAGSVVAVYDVVYIVPVPAQSRCEFPLLTAMAAPPRPLEIREHAIFWRSAGADGHQTWTELALGDIRAVRPLERHLIWRIPVEKRDGSCVFLTVFRGQEQDRELEAEVRSVIAGRIEALSGEAASSPSPPPK